MFFIFGLQKSDAKKYREKVSQNVLLLFPDSCFCVWILDFVFLILNFVFLDLCVLDFGLRITTDVADKFFYEIRPPKRNTRHGTPKCGTRNLDAELRMMVRNSEK